MSAQSPPWIEVGFPPDAALSPDQLHPEELQQLQQLLGAREQMLAQLAEVERRVELLALTARDRRGLRGPVRIHPTTGAIRAAEE